MPFQIKQNTLNLSVPIERLAGAYYRIQRTKQNISLSCLAKELRMNKGFLSDLENGKRHFPDGLCKQIDSILNTNFNTNYDLYILSRKYLFEIFENFFFERQQSILDIYKIIQESENNIINSYAYFTFKIVQLFYYLRIEKNNSKIIEIEALLNQNLNCLQSDEISIYYSLLGIFYKRDVASNHIALDYFLKSNMMCNSSSIVYSMNIFQLISVYAELNQPTLAYEKCIFSKALLKQHNNYSRIITVDMFECITLTDLGLYNESKEKLRKAYGTLNISRDKGANLNKERRAVNTSLRETISRSTNKTKEALDDYINSMNLEDMQNHINSLKSDYIRGSNINEQNLDSIKEALKTVAYSPVNRNSYFTNYAKFGGLLKSGEPFETYYNSASMGLGFH